MDQPGIGFPHRLDGTSRLKTLFRLGLAIGYLVLVLGGMVIFRSSFILFHMKSYRIL